jgi:hypothetical protein
MKKTKFDDIERTFSVVSEDFKEMIEMKFKVSLVESNGTVQFETSIPDYIFDEAKKIWPEDYDFEFIKTKREENKVGNLDWQLKKVKSKVLRHQALVGIESELWDLSKKIQGYHTFDEKIGDKVIMIYFRGSSSTQRERHFGGDMGLENNINFQYFTAYHHLGQEKKWLSDDIITVEKFTAYYKCGMSEQGENHKYKESQLVPLHHTYEDLRNLKGAYIMIPWSEEREQYLKAIQNNFTNLTEKLNEFLKDLTEEKLDNLIENHPVQKLLSN